MLDKRRYSTRIRAMQEHRANLLEQLEPSKPYCPPKGPIEYPEVQTNEMCYAVRQSMMSAWVAVEVIEIIEPTKTETKQYLVKYINPNGITEQLVCGSHLAYGSPPSVCLTVGIRVIALGQDVDKRSHYYPGVIAESLQPFNEWRYLVFFDDGHVQYVSPDNVRLVCEAPARAWDIVHIHCRPFIETYLSNCAEPRPMVHLRAGQRVNIELNGKWIVARVRKVDASIVQIHFMIGGSTQWMYRGVKRFVQLFSKQEDTLAGFGFRKRNEPYVEYVSVTGELKARVAKPEAVVDVAVVEKASDGKTKVAQKRRRKGAARVHVTKKRKPNAHCMQNSTMYMDENKNPRGLVFMYAPKVKVPITPFKEHMCGPTCVPFDMDEHENICRYPTLFRPILYGWKREEEHAAITYTSPCGRKLGNMNELYSYLRLTDSPLNVDHFSYDTLVQILAEYVISDRANIRQEDLSDGVEHMPVHSVNDYDNTTPVPHVYSNQRIPSEGVPLNLDPDFLCCCDCEDDCSDKSKCQCWRLTIEGAASLNRTVDHADVGYFYNRLPFGVATGIYECNSRCKCKQTCLNRVVQHPHQLQLQVFQTPNRGWGLRCVNDIPQGAFISTYAADILTEQHSNEIGIKSGDEYFAALDFIEHVERLKEGYEAEAAIMDDVAAESKKRRGSTRSRKQQAKADEGSERPRISYMPDPNIEEPDSPSPNSIRQALFKDDSVYILDSKKTGNISRYVNHSCDPNLFVQSVFVDSHDLRFPWVAFFAQTNIRAGTELTWNYNYDVGSVVGRVMDCKCGADTCVKRLL